jgi:hypothetical protein
MTAFRVWFSKKTSTHIWDSVMLQESFKRNLILVFGIIQAAVCGTHMFNWAKSVLLPVITDGKLACKHM